MTYGMERIVEICASLEPYINNDINNAEMALLEEEEERKASFERYKKSGTPSRYLQESFETYNVSNDIQSTALSATKFFVSQAKCRMFKTLVLLGNAGTGKTHLACSAIREVGGKYRTASEIVEEIRNAKSFNVNVTESQLIERYGNTPLLVIDEIGRGIYAPDEKYMLYQILNARYNTRKPTLLVSNHNKKDFLQYIGIAAADRLVESADIIEMNGESYRLTKRAINDKSF